MKVIHILLFVLVFASSGESSFISTGVPKTSTQSVTPSFAYEGNTLKLYTSYYDDVRLSPITVTMIYDTINKATNTDSSKLPWSKWHVHTQPACNLERPYNPYNFTQVQANYAGYPDPNTPTNARLWDKGHLAPANMFRFDKEAKRNTYYCINASPQEPYSNRCIWKGVEKKVQDMLYSKSQPAIIVTGTSSANIVGDLGRTLEKIETPTHFWKLICYKEGSTTIVVGYVIENTLINNRDENIRKNRKESAETPRSQREVLGLTSAAIVENAWNSATNLAQGRPTANMAPAPIECSRALELNDEHGLEWDQYFKSMKDIPREDQDCSL